MTLRRMRIVVNDAIEPITFMMLTCSLVVFMLFIITKAVIRWG